MFQHIHSFFLRNSLPRGKAGRFLGIIGILLVTIAIGLTVFIAQKSQDIRQRASTLEYAADVRQNSATFSFPLFASDPEPWHGFWISVSNQSDFGSEINYYFGYGASSPVTVNPILWDQYSCGKVFYWRVHTGYNNIPGDASRAVHTASPIQGPITVDCSAPSPIPTLIPTSTPTQPLDVNNLLSNPGFEQEGGNPAPSWAQWDGGPYGPLIRTNDKALTGQWSLKGNVNTNSGHSVIQTITNLEPNKEYEFSVFVFTDDARTFIDTGDNDNFGRLNTLIAECESRVSEINVWHKVACRFKTKPDQTATSVAVRVIAYTVNTWFDDAEVKAFVEPTITPIPSPTIVLPTTAPTPSYSEGDVSGDGQVDLNDFTAWKIEFLEELTSGTSPKTADLNNDGNVTLDDFLLWKIGFLKYLGL